jgi:SsrA-binding protein
MPPKNEAADITLVASNKKAFHDYFISDKVEAGLVLVGTEVKSLRDKGCNLRDSYARVTPRREMELLNFHISPYAQGNRFNLDPTRSRKLLLHRKEIDRLAAKVQEKGFTLVPLRVYFRDNLAKVEIGLAKGKEAHDKREAIKQREGDLEARRAVRIRSR